MEDHLGNTSYLFLLLLLPLLAFLLFRFLNWKKQRQAVFAEAPFRENLFGQRKRWTWVFYVLYFAAFLFLILAILDIRGEKKHLKVKQKTSAVMFLLDVSNSMNAQDISPSRLELAKSIIIQSIQKMHDGKVGIVLFAGDARSIMPLTTDYSAAETYLSSLETSVIGRQGTDFLKAVEMASQKFKNLPKGSRKVILISDGEDQEGNEQEAINQAQKEGITIYSVGVGTDQGSPIPVYEYGQLMGYKTDKNGETVITKRQTNALVSLAYETEGKYVDGNQLEVAVAEILKLQKIKSEDQVEVEAQSSLHYYQWFLGISLILFFMVLFFNPRKDFNF